MYGYGQPIGQPIGQPMVHGQQVIHAGFPGQQVQYLQQPGYQQVISQPIVQPQPSVQYVQHQYVPQQPQAPVEPAPGPPAMDAQTYAHMKAIVAKFVADGSNTLSIPELINVMREVGMDPGEDVAAMFQEYDIDGNGKISFTEFMAAFQTPPQVDRPQVQMTVGPDGKFVDQEFPPNNDSIFRSPNPAADHVQDVMAHSGGGQVRWVRASELTSHGKLFNNIHPNDIAQGVLGDCWLLAGMAGMAEFEGAILHLFQDKKANDMGMYTINIHNPVTKQWTPVVVDDYIPIGPDNNPLMAKPQGNEMWVLLLEKAFAKWFGSYCQIQGAYCLVGYMLMADCQGHCKAFTQSPSGRPPFNENMFTVMGAHLQDPKNRNSIGLQPMGSMGADAAWQELVKHDAANHIMCAWTSKDPPVAAGRGASGEVIAGDGIVKGHAYSLISAREVMADGRVWKVLQLRNPWGANPAAEWKGPLSDNWNMWGNFPELYQALEMGQGTLDGMFWINWDDFRNRYSDIGIVPKQMEVPRMGVVEGAEARPGHAKHVKKFKKDPTQQPVPAAPMPVAAPEAPRYVQPTKTIYASAQTYAAAPAHHYAAAPAAPAVTYTHAAAAPTYSAAPVTYAAAPTYSAAPMTYAGAPYAYAPTSSVRLIQ